MNGMLSEFKSKAPVGFLVAALSLATAAQANAQQTIDFKGHPLNCATLQGQSDPIPNGMTCGFVEEIEQYIAGPKLQCPSDKEGHTFSAMQSAARHMSVSHGQPALFAHLESIIAKLNAQKRGTTMVAELQNAHPDSAREFAFTHVAIEETAQRLKQGLSRSEAMGSVVAIFNQRGWDLPGNGQDIESLQTYWNQNPVVDGYLACIEAFPKPSWNTYERR